MRSRLGKLLSLIALATCFGTASPDESIHAGPAKTLHANDLLEALLSPEETTAAMPDMSRFDVTHDGHVDMLDWARLAGVPGQWTSIYVGPPGEAGDSGDGSPQRPFPLSDGNEYVNTDVVFLDGVYLNVRLQIIKSSSRASAAETGSLLTLRDPKGPPVLQDGRPVYQPARYRLCAAHNSGIVNCRVPLTDRRTDRAMP